MNNSICSCFLMGGLGNLLFQISATYAYGYRYNKKPILYSSLYEQPPHGHMSQFYDNIFKNLHIEDICPLTSNNTFLYHEPAFHYIPIPELKQNILIQGYFQSQKYFIDYEDKIRNLFSTDIDVKKDVCAIHIRRGDYLRLAHHHPLQPMSYYSDAINTMGYNYKYLIFSDDIEWCRNNLENELTLKDKIDIEYTESGSTYIDFVNMTSCQHHIIANSSFSWWAAWLNNQKNHKVICPNPKRWFGPAYKNKNTTDIPCDEWICI